MADLSREDLIEAAALELWPTVVMLSRRHAAQRGWVGINGDWDAVTEEQRVTARIIGEIVLIKEGRIDGHREDG